MSSLCCITCRCPFNVWWFQIVDSVYKYLNSNPGIFLFLLAIIMRVQGATTVLSNFFMWSIQFMGMLFPSVEHVYQFLKARFHGRPDLCQQILKAPTAAAAKQIQVTNDWNDRWVSHGRPSRPQVLYLSSFPTDTAFIRRFHRPHHTRHLLGDRHRKTWPGTQRFWSPPRQT